MQRIKEIPFFKCGKHYKETVTCLCQMFTFARQAVITDIRKGLQQNQINLVSGNLSDFNGYIKNRENTRL